MRYNEIIRQYPSKITESTEPPLNAAFLLHGSNAEFDHFDDTKAKSGMQGKAIYLTNSEWYARKFGTKIMKVSFKRHLNTVSEEEAKDRDGSAITGRMLERWVKENGYDGVWRNVGMANSGEVIWELACYDATALEIRADQKDQI